MWCVADLDDAYIARMEDVLATYEKPRHAAEPVLCLDEKPVSLHADVRPSRPARPGHVAKCDNEYRRCGTANIFAVVEPKTGRHLNSATPNRKAGEFAAVLARIEKEYAQARKIHLVMDNLKIHCQKSLLDHFGPEEGARLWQRFRVHYTPKHGSWLNQAEIELSMIARQCLGSRRFPTLADLQKELKAWNQAANQKQIRIQWTFNRKAARRKFGYVTNSSTRSKT